MSFTSIILANFCPFLEDSIILFIDSNLFNKILRYFFFANDQINWWSMKAWRKENWLNIKHKFSLIPKSIEISEQNFSPYLDLSNTFYFLCFSSLSFLNDSLKFLVIISYICGLQKRKPFVIPFYISNNLIHCCLFNLHSRLSWQKYLSIAFFHLAPMHVKALNLHQK